MQFWVILQPRSIQYFSLPQIITEPWVTLICSCQSACVLFLVYMWKPCFKAKTSPWKHLSIGMDIYNIKLCLWWSEIEAFNPSAWFDPTLLPDAQCELRQKHLVFPHGCGSHTWTDEKQLSGLKWQMFCAWRSTPRMLITLQKLQSI